MPDIEFTSGIARADYLHVGPTKLASPIEVKVVSPLSPFVLAQRAGTEVDEQRIGRMAQGHQRTRYRREMENFSIAYVPTSFVRLTGSNDVREYVGVMGAKLTGARLNQLLLALAPSTVFGLDTEDIITDWGRVDNNHFGPIIARHMKHIGLAWEAFETERVQLRDQIEKWGVDANDPTKRGVTPIIHIQEEEDKRRMVFTDLTQEPYRSAVELTGERITDDTVLSPVTGVWVSALFSPDVIKRWPYDAKYHKDGGWRSLGTTQVGLYAIDQAHQITNGSFVSQIIEECDK